MVRRTLNNLVGPAVALVAIGLLCVGAVAATAEAPPKPPPVANYEIAISGPDGWTAELGEKLRSVMKESEPAGAFKFRITGLEPSDDLTRAYSHVLLESGWYVAARLSKDPKVLHYLAERIPPMISDADLREVRDISFQVAQTLLYACADMVKTESDKPASRTAKLILTKSIDRRIIRNLTTGEYSAQLYVKGAGKRVDLAELAEGRIALR